MANQIISWVVLTGIIGYLLGILLVFCFKHKGWSEKVNYIKTFKFGKWSILFIICIPLFVIGYMSNGNGVGDSIFRAFTSTFKLITLSFDFTFKITEELVIFKAALWTCYIAVLINDLLFAASCLFQSFWSAWKRHMFWFTKSEKVFIIGHDANSTSIFQSANCRKIVVDILDDDGKDELFKAKIPYKAFRDTKNSETKFLRLVKYLEKNILQYAKKHSKLAKDQIDTKATLKIIVNTDSIEQNIALSDHISQMYGSFADKIQQINKECYELLEKTKDPKLVEKIKAKYEKIRTLYQLALNDSQVYVFANKENQDIFYGFEQLSKGHLRFIDKHVIVANDFITTHPLAYYLNKEHVDYSTGLIKDGVNINALFIGFGKTNQQIFQSMLATCTFLTKNKDGNIVPKDVNYHFFDKKSTIKDKNMNSYVLRYAHEFLHAEPGEINLKDYLDQPNFKFVDQVMNGSKKMDINDPKFLSKLKKILTSKEQQPAKTLSYIVVSLGDDFETLDVVKKIDAKIKQWGIKNTQIFAHISHKNMFDNKTIFKDCPNIHKFGCSKDVVYKYNKITNEFYEQLAIKQNLVYSDTFDVNGSVVYKITKDDLNSWASKVLYDRYNSLLAVLSIRHKLLLMNMDIVNSSDLMNNLSKYKVLTDDEYRSKYSNGYPIEIKDGKIVDPMEFIPSLRTNLAMIEHDRWNNCLMTQGFIPMTINKFKTNYELDFAGSPKLRKDGSNKLSTKDWDKKEHICITTWQGLGDLKNLYDEYRHYDYQLLDYLPSILLGEKYYIVERK